MRQKFLIALVVTGLTACGIAQNKPELKSDDAPKGLEIPYQRFVLDNGLTVIVHEDHKAPKSWPSTPGTT
jgi:hypothetical protein